MPEISTTATIQATENLPKKHLKFCLEQARYWVQESHLWAEMAGIETETYFYNCIDNAAIELEDATTSIEG